MLFRPRCLQVSPRVTRTLALPGCLPGPTSIDWDQYRIFFESPALAGMLEYDISSTTCVAISDLSLAPPCPIYALQPER